VTSKSLFNIDFPRYSAFLKAYLYQFCDQEPYLLFFIDYDEYTDIIKNCNAIYDDIIREVTPFLLSYTGKYRLDEQYNIIEVG
jgi:hypothetical protein